MSHTCHAVSQAEGAIPSGGLTRIVRAVSKISFYLGAALLIIIMFMVTVDSTGRFIFNKPILGALEMTEFLLAGAVLLGLAHTQHIGANVMVELLYDRFSPRLQNIQRIFSHLVGAVFFAFVTWHSGVYALDGMQDHLTSDLLQIPAWPFLFFAPIGCALLTLELIIETFEDIREYQQGRVKG